MISPIKEYLTGLILELKDITGGGDMLPALIFISVLGFASGFIFKIYNMISSVLRKQLATELTVSSTHASFYNIADVLQKHKLSSRSRTISLVDYFNDEENKVLKGVGLGDHLAFLYNKPIIVSLSEEKSGNTTIQTMKIKKFGRSHELFDRLIKEASVTSKSNLDKTLIYEAGEYGLDRIARNNKYSIDNVILPAADKEELLNRIKIFRESEEWYVNRSIPYQFGILLYGPAGTGKTSLVKGIAEHLDLDIIMTDSPASIRTANNTFKQGEHLICVEEVDTIGLANRQLEKDEHIDPNTSGSSLSKIDKMLLGKLLSSLDGITDNHGRIMIMTTNDISSLDKSLIRPGRIDFTLKVDCLIEETFFKMLDKFDVEYDDTFNIKENISPAQLQEDLVKGLSLKQLEEKYEK